MNVNYLRGHQYYKREFRSKVQTNNVNIKTLVSTSLEARTQNCQNQTESEKVKILQVYSIEYVRSKWYINLTI